MSVDLLLANPLFLSQSEAERELMSPYFPLGLLYLAAYVREHGYDVAIFDGTFVEDEGAFVQALEQHNPRIVGLTALLPNRESVLRLAQAAKAFGSTVVVGGPDPTREPAIYLAEPGVDVVVHHEGEETLVELLGALGRDESGTVNLNAIRGLAFRGHDGEMIITPPRPYISNLDNLPLPARDLIDMDKYLDVWRDENGYASLSISVSRGCPYGCEWCQEAANGPDLRQRSPESVVSEMKALKETYRIDRLRVVDDVDGISRDWMEAWADVAEEADAVIPFEALYDLERQDIPMLDVRDSL